MIRASRGLQGPPSRMNARHGRVTTRAAGGATELLGDGWMDGLLFCVIVTSTEYEWHYWFWKSCRFSLVCFLCSGNSKRLTLYVTQSAVTGREVRVPTCRAPDFLFVQLLLDEAIVPLLQCLCLHALSLLFSSLSSSPISTFPVAHFHASPLPPPDSHKVQLPTQTNFFPQDRTWGFMRRKKLEEGCGGEI